MQLTNQHKENPKDFQTSNIVVSDEEIEKEKEWLRAFFNEVTDKELTNCAKEIILLKKDCPKHDLPLVLCQDCVNEGSLIFISKEEKDKRDVEINKLLERINKDDIRQFEAESELEKEFIHQIVKRDAEIKGLKLEFEKIYKKYEKEHYDNIEIKSKLEKKEKEIKGWEEAQKILLDESKMGQLIQQRNKDINKLEEQLQNSIPKSEILKAINELEFNNPKGTAEATTNCTLDLIKQKLKL